MNYNNTHSNDILSIIRNNPNFNRQYEYLKNNPINNKEWSERFTSYIAGKKTLPLLYDPFFKAIFNGDEHRQRLSQLVSSILGQELTVIDVLPSESSNFADSFIIMDMIVRMSDGSLANIEVQKIPSLFPAERLSCYSSDAIMRQYHRLSSLNEDWADTSPAPHTFSYKDMKKVHTIIFFEHSSKNLISPVDSHMYFHIGKTRFNTDINLELLQEFHLISLDTFRKYRYSDIIKGNVNPTEYDYDNTMYPQPLTDKMLRNRLMFLSLFVADDIKDTYILQDIFPELKSIFKDMNEYLTRPGEVLNMFSEALRILDHNTAMLMVDEYRKKFEELSQQVEDANKELNDTIAANKEEIDTMQNAINMKNKELNDKNEQLADKDQQLKQLQNELAKLKENYNIKE